MKTKVLDPFNDWIFFLAYCIFFGIFLKAFFSPNQQLTIAVNYFGEALFELILFGGLFLYGAGRILWDIKTRTNSRGEKIYLGIFLALITLMILSGSQFLLSMVF